MVLSCEVEVFSAGPIEEVGADGDYDDDDYGDDYAGPATAGGMAPASSHDDIVMDDLRGPFAHSVPQQCGALQLQTILPRPATNHGLRTPMVVQSPTSVSFENPAMASMFELHPHPSAGQMHAQFPGQFMQQGVLGHGGVHDDKAAGPKAVAPLMYYEG